MSIHRLRWRSHNKGTGSAYRGLTCVALAALACAAPGVARAHGGGHFVAGPAATPPTVDGVVGGSEWAGATPYTVPFGSLGNGTIRFLHTPTHLYIAGVVTDVSPGLTPSLGVFFDNDHDGVKELGDDEWRARIGVGTGGLDRFYSPTGSDGPSHYNDAARGGTNDTVGVANNSGNNLMVFELRHPLCSADRAHDVCTSLGQTLGINFQYDRSTPGVFANSPGPDLFDPSNNWADLILAANDVTPPTVSITAPTAASVLRGTVSVTADASDNVGVTSVDFRYFGGSLPFVELGTDTEAPYTATFDTTEVANTGVNAASIQAVAHDEAGNTKTATNAVTIDNTTPSRIAFESDRAGNSEIYSMSPAGTGVTRLTNSAAADSRPSLSPDGNLIAWESAGQVWVMASDGSNKRALTSVGTSGAPAFSPNGTKIAFQSDRGAGMDIWVMNASGTGQTNLTNALGADLNPGWSPDGTRLAFDSSRSGNRDVFTMNANGTGQTNRTATSLQLDADPDWSPDGTKILFVSARSARTSVWTMNTDGSGAVDTTQSSIYDADPSWSPDGAHIVFSRDAGGQTFNLWTARADGTAKLRVTDAPGTQRNSFPDWGVRAAATSSVDVTSFEATPVNPKAGIAQVDLDDVPASVLLAPSRTTESAPLGETPLGETPLGETPLGETPLGETSLGLDDLIADLRTVPLSSLPLLREGGWPAVLAPTSLANRVLQNVSLGDVFALTPRPAVLDGQGDDDITLADLDYSRSSLGDVVAIAYALGSGVTLADLSGAFENGVLDPELQSWCTITNTPCSQTSVLSLGLKGAPLGETPLGETPLGETLLWDTPLGETPLGETPLGETPLGETPLGETPLGETALAGTPLGETPLGETDLSRAPLGETPLGETPLGETDLNHAPLGETPLGETPLGETPLGETPLGETLISDIQTQSCTTIFVSCPPGTHTIDQHLGELQPNVTIADLVAVLTPAAQARLTLGDLVASLADPNAFSVAQLLAVLDPPSAYTLAQVAAIFTEASGVTLGDLVASLPNPNAFTLNDLLIAVLRAGAQWEQIDLTQPALAAVATGGGTVDLTSDLTVTGSSVLTFTVNLPRGWTAIDTGTIQSVASGATTLEVVDVEPTPDGGTRYILRTQFAVTGNQQFHFSVRPGITLGPATASLSVATAQGNGETAPPDSVDVQETLEPNNDPATAPMLAPGAFYLSYLTSTTDTDFFRVNVPATGTRTTIRLSHLPKDYDLVVYGRQGTTPLVQPGSAAPLETPVLADSGAPITHLSEALSAETLDDLRVRSDRPVLGVSAFRTTEDEAVVAVSDGGPGEYVVQVTGYNGATSVQPYMLRVESEAPRLPPTCQPRFPGLSFGAATGVDLASIPADTDTLFLANGPQLGAAGGLGVLDWFTSQHFNQLRGTGHPSAVVRLENDPAVRAAYTAWNLEPCSTARANGVVRAITDVVRTIRNARPAVRNLVLLGNDKALPFARLDDLTTIANEADYASTFARGDDLYGPMFEHRVLSDDPYATTDPIPYLQKQLFVPQLAVGRLVETQAQITGALDRFVAFGGDLDPASARTTGYDFLKDGAADVAAAFAGIIGAQQPATNPPLIGDLWTSTTLQGALSTTTGLFGMNGHADHHRLQPAAGSGLFSAANLPASLQRAVVFSMGCHSALSVSDAAVAQAIDWPQTYAGKGAAAYAGNLGFGYGDSVTVAYSEALNVRLAQGLRNGLPIGEALVEAKQGYLASLGIVGVYDEKAMSELALYGLPMWSLGGATTPSTPPPLPSGVTLLSTDPDPITGLMTDHYRSQPSTTGTNPALKRIDRGTESYWTGPSGVQVTHLRPLQPKAAFQVAPDAHGVLITGLESTDFSGIDPVYARPIVDNSAAEPELPFADVAFPAKIQSLVSQQTRTGPKASAVLVQGQFFSDDTPDAKGAGNQRLFTRVDLDVLRSNGTDRVAPRYDAIDAVVLPGPGIVSFSADVVDLPGENAANVARVLVAFRDGTSSTWRFLDLRRGPGASWGGTAPVSGTQIEYFMQAVDASGNVAVSTNKGLLFSAAPPAPPSGTGVEPSLTGTKIAGWFFQSAQLDIEAVAGVVVSVSIDHGPLTPFTGPITLASDGLHTIEVLGSNGYQETLYVPVDSGLPTVDLDQPGATVPLNGTVPLAFRCGDASSGVATCTATVDGVERPAGFEVPATPQNSIHEVRLTATDRVGNSETKLFTYTVRTREIVYASTNTGSGDIYLLPANAGPSTPPTRLTETSFPEADPVWSPDSERIAFASNRDGTWRIYLMDADGTDVTLLPTGVGDATDPAWSPDGGRIAFVSSRKKNPDIWVVDLNGSNLRQLTTDTKWDVAPTWSPQTTNPQIMWSNGPGGQLDLWKMNPNSPNAKTRVTTSEDLNTEAAWGSNGTIAFARRAKGGSRFEIWRMPAAGGAMTRIIVSNVRNDTQPSWLQDGKLVFASDRDEERDYDLFRTTDEAPTGWSHVRVTNAPGDDRGPNG